MATDNSQEGVPDAFKLGKILASQDKETRDKGVEVLAAWLKNKKNATELDYMKVWRALFYCLWMSDKPIIQHELAKTLSSLLHTPPTSDATLLFIQAFLKTIIREWPGIDKFRLDKYLWLLRFFVNDYMRFMKDMEYDDGVFDALNIVLLETALNPVSAQTYHGLVDHLVDVFLSELSKVLGDEWWLQEEAILLNFFFPWLELLSSCDNPTIVHHMVDELWENVVAAYVRVRELAKRAKGEEVKKAQKSKESFLSLMETLDEAIFELAKSPDTLERNRKALYNLHSTFQLNMVEKTPTSKKRERSVSASDETLADNASKKSKQRETDNDAQHSDTTPVKATKEQTKNSASKPAAKADTKLKSTSERDSPSASTKLNKESNGKEVKNGKDVKNAKSKKSAPVASHEDSDEEIHGESPSDDDLLGDEYDLSSGSEDMDGFDEMDEEALLAAINGGDFDDDEDEQFSDLDSEEETPVKPKKLVKMIKTPPKSSEREKSVSPSRQKHSPATPSTPKRVSWNEAHEMLSKKHAHKAGSPPGKSILKPTPAGPVVDSTHDATEINSFTEFASPYNHPPQSRILARPVNRVSNAQRKKLMKLTMMKAMRGSK